MCTVAAGARSRTGEGGALPAGELVGRGGGGGEGC